MGHSGSGGEAPTANAVTVKVVKNKCAPPFRQAQFAIRFGVGICRLSEVLELAIEAGFGPSSPGSWPATVPEQYCLGNALLPACPHCLGDADDSLAAALLAAPLHPAHGP